MDKNILQEILRKLFSGSSTSDEIDKINNWYDSFDTEESTVIEDYKNRKKNEIKNQLFEEIKRKSEIAKFERTNRFRFICFSIAAVLLVGFFALTWKMNNQFGHENVRETFVSFENGIGMIKTVKLPDGSSIRLHHNSSILINKDFNSKRHVILEGTAFFDVKPDANSPFTIQTETLKTTVLGTSFSIVNSPIQGEKIAVKTGKVNVFSNVLGSVELIELEAVELSKDGFLQSRIENTDLEFGWAQKSLVFDQTDMNSMISQIQDWYGVEISTKCEEFPNQKISGVYHDMSLEELLISIKFSIPLKFKINEKNVQLDFQECQ